MVSMTKKWHLMLVKKVQNAIAGSNAITHDHSKSKQYCLIRLMHIEIEDNSMELFFCCDSTNTATYLCWKPRP
jgi:hypothetical protein